MAPGKTLAAELPLPRCPPTVKLFSRGFVRFDRPMCKPTQIQALIQRIRVHVEMINRLVEVLREHSLQGFGKWIATRTSVAFAHVHHVEHKDIRCRTGQALQRSIEGRIQLMLPRNILDFSSDFKEFGE